MLCELCASTHITMEACFPARNISLASTGFEYYKELHLADKNNEARWRLASHPTPLMDSEQLIWLKS